MSTVELLRALIRNRCVNDGTADSGHEHRSVATLADYLGHRGEVFEPHPGRQSVVYRIPGSDPAAPSLALVPHLDVVPVNAAGWSVDPFAAELSDGLVWGRGAVDMLNLTAAMATVFKPYLDGERQLPGDLLLVAVADEENSGTLGARMLTSERWDLVRADYLLTEVAYPPIPTRHGPAYPVAVGEKGPFWTILRARGTPGHGSAPYGADNALEPLAAAVHGLFTTPMPISLTDEWRLFVAGLGLDDEVAAALTDPDLVEGAIDLIAAADPALARYLHAATHLTISPNVVSGGVKANVVADSARAEVDIRALPGMGRDFIDEHLRKAMGTAYGRLEVEAVADHPATVSPRGNPLWEAIVDAVESHTGSRRVLPTMMTVATDARFWRARGTIAYGVGLFDDRIGFGEFLTLFHGNDERVSVDSVGLTVSLLETVLANFGDRTR